MIVAMANDPVLVDHNHSALGAEPPVGAVRLRNCAIHIRKQRHSEAVLPDETLVGGHILGRDPDDCGT